MSIEKQGPADESAGKVATAVDRPELRFPDQPRLELDEALERVGELIARVRGTQGRLRSLIRANAAVTRDLRLPAVLQLIAEAARDLCGARYAALGVIGHGALLEQFIHVGVDEETAARIGDLPQGAGILGLLIRHPKPIRLNDLGRHGAASGLPAGHPPMSTFLGAPIIVGGEVYGNLYLTESTRGAFTTEDEELLVALAGTAGIAIQNARLFDKSESQRSWLEAAAVVNQKLLRREAGSLAVVLKEACRAAGAETASVITDLHGGGWTLESGSGSEARFDATLGVANESTIAWRAIQSGEAVRVEDVGASDTLNNSEFGAFGPGLSVPLMGADSRVFGCLSVARRMGRPGFTDDDVEHLGGFANHVAVAIELDRSLRARETIHIAEDHARIAADLHDHVIQDLFATGLRLQAAAALIPAPEAQQPVLDAVSALDATIQKIRAAIFRIQTPADRPSSLDERLLETVRTHEPALGFSPTVTISGSVGAVADRDLIENVMAVTSEALSNVARYANARAASVEVASDGTQLTITIADDGDGMGLHEPTGGLVDVRQQAEARSGRLEIAAGPAGGTRVTWTAALRV